MDQFSEIRNEDKNQTFISNFSMINNLQENRELPILEEMGVDMKSVIKKLNSTVFIQQPIKEFLEEPDLTGPILLTTILGMLLIFNRKLNFGFIYGYGFFGCLVIYFLLNLILDNYIQLYDVVSIIGYCITPVLFVSVINLFVNMKKTIGIIVSIFFSILSTVQVLRILQTKHQLEKRRNLIAYPIFLLYQTFIILIIS